jgi:hypothetical protein
MKYNKKLRKNKENWQNKIFLAKFEEIHVANGLMK